MKFMKLTRLKVLQSANTDSNKTHDPKVVGQEKKNLPFRWVAVETFNASLGIAFGFKIFACFFSFLIDSIYGLDKLWAALVE